MPPPSLLAVHDLRKDFGAVRALDGVSLAFPRGRTVGVVGENGAGKSTLMKILAGVVRPTSGRVVLDGQDARWHAPRDATNAGVVMIHQELNLVDELSVADNLFLGREARRIGPLVHRRRMHAEALALLSSLKCPVDPRAKVKRLSIAHKQMVEIARALSMRSRVLIMDEPTAVLTAHETAVLFDAIRRLKSQGVTILYISHILQEVRAICDEIVVMRDGRVVARTHPGESTEADLANLMVGRKLSDMFPPRSPVTAEDAALRVQNLTAPGCATDVSFEVRHGEVFGFAGLVGSGRTETAEAVVGLRRRTGGSVEALGRRVFIGSPRDALREGVVYLSEDRKERGLILDMNVTHNVTLATLRKYCRAKITRRSQEKAATRAYVASLAIRVARPDKPVARLSGGNQQKVALAKWLDAEPRVLILDEPTRGVDVGAKREIYGLIKALADAGKAIVVISSEMTELLGLCHRIAVMRGGRIAGVLDGPSATEQSIMHLAAGIENRGGT